MHSVDCASAVHTKMVSKRTIGSDDELDAKRREILSEATSKTLFGSVLDLSDLARLGKRLLPSLRTTLPGCCLAAAEIGN